MWEERVRIYGILGVHNNFPKWQKVYKKKSLKTNEVKKKIIYIYIYEGNREKKRIEKKNNKWEVKLKLVRKLTERTLHSNEK